MGAFLQGIIMGLAITVSFGPGFIALFQTSIEKGIRSGYILAIGILVSDLVLITVSYFGVSSIQMGGNHVIMGAIAGSILFIFGAVTFFKKATLNLDHAEQYEVLKANIHSLLIKGFLVNIANPFVTIFWIRTISYASGNYGIKTHGFFIFFTGLILTAFSSDLLKCYLSGSLRKLFTSRTVFVINKIIGIVLMALGIIIFYKVL
jgi:threonine/homoserine/homoserine lactone efflux protein